RCLADRDVRRPVAGRRRRRRPAFSRAPSVLRCLRVSRIPPLRRRRPRRRASGIGHACETSCRFYLCEVQIRAAIRYYRTLTVRWSRLKYLSSMSSVATLPTESRYSKLSYLTCAVLIWFHIQAVAAFWSFSWTNLFVAVFLYWVAIGLGISMGYHRLHTHRGFKTYRLFEYFLAICGTLTLEGGPIFWVATHRKHHQHSDQELDPHTPRVNGFWAHLGWIVFGEAHHNDTAQMAKYAPDLAK